MEDPSFLLARNVDELAAALEFVTRDGSNCAECNTKCPACPSGESCQFTVPLDCTECAKSFCTKDETSSSGSGNGGDSDDGGGGPNIGAIVGGVIGGLIVIAVLSFLVWKYFVKPNRARMTESVYEPGSIHASGAEKDNSSPLTRRSSTHTVHSIASTVLTRASNIIQIAYIPGVTNRASPSSPTVLVPPVPPIPMHHTEGRETGQDDQHFFMPGDLRDSTYSGISGYSDRTSYARTSYAPRSSIASTIYGKQAQVFTSTQTGMRAKPTMVSVKSNGGSPGSTPPVPSIDFERFANGRPKSGASTFSVGSTFLNNANTATQARAQVVKVGSGLKKVDVGPKSDTDSSQNSVSGVSLHSLHPPSREANTANAGESSPSPDQGPFSDPPATPNPLKSISTPTLGVVIEDAPEDDDERARPSGADKPGSIGRTSSPFGDEHATKE